MSPVDGFALVLPHEPLAVRLMNTVWSDRAVVHDALSGVVHLHRWVAATSPETSVGDADLAAFRALRDALREVAAHCTAGRSGPPDRVERAVRVVNRAVHAVPTWTELVLAEDGPSRRPGGSGTPAARLLSRIAAQSVDLFADGRLAACRAPRCVHYYTANGRRQWCSSQCGNRVRVARHYHRHQSSAS